MKRVLASLLFVLLCLLAVSALAAVRFYIDPYGSITKVANLSSEALTIPAFVDVDDALTPVTGINQDALTEEEWQNLKAVLFMHTSFMRGSSFDLSKAINLEAICLNMPVPSNTNTLPITARAGVDILQYVDFAKKRIDSVSHEITNGSVLLRFPNIIPTDYPAAYVVTRETEDASAAPERFISSGDGLINFSTSAGMVTFTDLSVDEGEIYTYTLFVLDAFGNSSKTQSLSVDLAPAPVPPADPGLPGNAAGPMPDTGDDASWALWLALLGGACTLLLLKKTA